MNTTTIHGVHGSAHVDARTERHVLFTIYQQRCMYLFIQPVEALILNVHTFLALAHAVNSITSRTLESMRFFAEQSGTEA